MSQYIKILNMLKENIVRLTLTPGQAACRVHILERLEYPGIINLYGARGSGKTVLGWCLASEGHAQYIVEPMQLGTERLTNSGPSSVFIDNADHRRVAYRHILDKLAHARIRRAIIATQERIEDFVQAVPLTCTLADITTAADNLSRLGFPPTQPSDNTPYLDLWDVLCFTARR
jgi:hypothetical protein